jgi:hypothetical protein
MVGRQPGYGQPANTHPQGEVGILKAVIRFPIKPHG